MKTTNSLQFLGFLAASTFLTACSMKNYSGATAPYADVTMESKSGSNVSGDLHLEEHHGGLIVQGKLSGLTPGKHGIHVHTKGDCSAADASSAQGHYAFHKEDKHGAPGSGHAGDLGNITANSSGDADVNIFAKGLGLAKSKHSIDGRALVIHASTDDLKSDPAGNSGARVACGVIKASMPPPCDCNDAKCEKCHEDKENCHCKDMKPGKHHHMDGKHEHGKKPAPAPSPAPEGAK